jgi:hypothetical protein
MCRCRIFEDESFFQHHLSHTLAGPFASLSLSLSLFLSLDRSLSHLPCFNSRPLARSLALVLMSRAHRWGVTLVAAGLGGSTLYYILRNMSGPVIKNDFLEQALGQVCPCLFASPGESHYHNPELECITALQINL